MKDRKQTLGVIIARAGSKGLPSKHIRMLLDKPVIAYTLEAALKAKSLDKVIVSSDDKEVCRIARNYGVEAYGRPAELCNDTATVDSAARFAVDRVEELQGFHPDAIAILYGNIPIRPDGLIDLAVNHLLETGCDSVQTYSPVGKFHPDWMIRLEEGDKVVLNCTKPIYRRQDLTPMFIPNGAVVAVTHESLYRKPANPQDFHCFLGKDRRGVVHPESDLIVDVDGRRDLYIAEAILRMIKETQNNAAEQDSPVLG
jgi:CMP-N,N'-diacetyllegionaminic acid synthase